MLSAGELRFRVLTPADATIAAGWLSMDQAALLDRDNAYYSILDGAGDLAGCCCYGRPARVEGGDYRAQAIDLSTTPRPDVCADEDLRELVRGVALFSQPLFNVAALRVSTPAEGPLTLAWESAGFRPLQRFIGPGQVEYLQLALAPSGW